MGAATDPDTSSGLLRLLAGPLDDAAWRTFVERYTPLIERCCRAARLQPADAEEVRSRVLARLVRALGGFQYDPARSFRGYLRAVVNNAVRSYWRERARPGATGTGDEGPGGLDRVEVPDVMAALADSIDDDAGQRLRVVQRVLEAVRRQVDPGTWQAYWMTAVEGRKAADVAREIGKSVGAVYMAKGRVAKLLREAGGADPPSA